MRRPRVTKRVRDRLRRLLPMEYRPSEIARELGVTKDTVYRGWIPAGAPHRRDEQGQLWLVGTDLAAWLRAQQRTTKVELGEGEAFCLRCQRAVRMVGEITEEPAKYATLRRGTCAECGGQVAILVSEEA